MAANLRWLSVAEAATQLSLSERTVRRRCESGKLTARIESTPSGKAWLVCLHPLKETADPMTEGVLEEAPQAQSSTRSQDTAATSTAIVPVLERSVSTPAATPLANAAANSEVLAELRHDVEQIKAYLTGQITAEMRDTLATLPSRDDIRDDLTAAMSAALLPVMQRLEELAGENAQLQTELHTERQKALAQVCRPWWKKLFANR